MDQAARMHSKDFSSLELAVAVVMATKTSLGMGVIVHSLYLIQLATWLTTFPDTTQTLIVRSEDFYRRTPIAMERVERCLHIARNSHNPFSLSVHDLLLRSLLIFNFSYLSSGTFHLSPLTGLRSHRRNTM